MARIPRLSKASALAEVAKRYRDQAKRAASRYPQSKPRTLAAIRVAELTRLYADIWGERELPADDVGYQAVRIMAHHLGRLRDGPRRISAWLQYYADWVSMADREIIISEVAECPLKWKADKLAWKFKVTEEQRARLMLRTVGSIDVSRAERIKRRKATNRANMQAYRRADGAKPRAQYLKSVKLGTPWVAAGCSRATWYRRHRET